MFQILRKRGRAWSGASYSAETLAYQTRVEADGGTVYSLDAVEAAYQFLTTNSLSPKLWCSPRFGWKNAGSNAVSKLYDLTSNNNDLVQATGAKQPTWTSAVQNGLPGLAMDGARKMAVTFSGALSQPNSIFFVGYKAAGASRTAYVDGIASGHRNSILDYYEGSYPVELYAGSAETWGTVTDLRGVSFILSAFFRDAVPAASLLYVNGVQKVSASPGTNDLTGITLGATVDPIYMKGSFFEVLVFNGDKTGNRSTIETYLNDVWALY